MRNDHKISLNLITSNIKFKDVTPEVITETFLIMVRFAPTIAAVPALAGHWVKVIVSQTYCDVEDIRILCEAELAARDVTLTNDLEESMFRAYLAGIRQGAYNREIDNPQFDPRIEFDKWFQED